jgi:effector-binding domain-containing protein
MEKENYQFVNSVGITLDWQGNKERHNCISASLEMPVDTHCCIYFHGSYESIEAFANLMLKKVRDAQAKELTIKNNQPLDDIPF